MVWRVDGCSPECVKEFVRAGFKDYTPTVQGFLAAKSCLLKNSFVSDGENMYIDPSKVQLSFRTLPLPANITAVNIAPGEL